MVNFPVLEIDETLQMELFKIIQELTTNTLKHAEAQKVELHLTVLDAELSLLFEDNGKGYDVHKTSEGIGSKNIMNRVKEMQGRLNIDSQLGRGTVIAIEVPLKKQQDD